MNEFPSNRINNFKKVYLFFFLLGIVTPDIDTTITTITNNLLRIVNLSIDYISFSHSLVSIGILYMLFLILYEIKKNIIIIKVAQFIILGMLAHILIDIVIWNNTIDIFWPLPIGKLNFWFYSYFQINFKYFIIGFHFIIFRLIASLLIDQLIENPNSNKNGYLKYLTIWMKYELYFFITFIGSIYFLSNILLVYSLLFIPSYIMTLFSIYKLKYLFKK